MSFAVIWQKQKVSHEPLAGEQKGCHCFFQHFVFKCNCLFAFFWVYTICSLIWDLKQFAISSRLWRSTSRKETKELSQTVSIKAANLQTLKVEGALRFIFRTLMWGPGSAGVLPGMGPLLKIKVFSKCEIFTACYLHKEISTSQFDVFWSHSLKLHTIGIAWKVQNNVPWSNLHKLAEGPIVSNL